MAAFPAAKRSTTLRRTAVLPLSDYSLQLSVARGRSGAVADVGAIRASNDEFPLTPRILAVEAR